MMTKVIYHLPLVVIFLAVISFCRGLRSSRFVRSISISTFKSLDIRPHRLFSTSDYYVDAKAYAAEMGALQEKLLITNDDGMSGGGNRRPYGRPYTAVSFFGFVPKDETPSTERIETILGSLRENLTSSDVLGTFLLSKEGYNSALIIPTENLQRTYLAIVNSDNDGLFEGLDWNVGRTHIYQEASEDPGTGTELENTRVRVSQEGLEFPFKKLLVKSKFAVLTDRIKEEVKRRGDGKEIDWTDAGPEVEASEWHASLAKIRTRDSEGEGEGEDAAQKRPFVLDCRNSYESEAGSFEGAIPLNTSIFSESWEKLDEILKNVPKDTPVMTFCTGGIRCIKVNAYLKQKLGMKNICRLKKGIIGYEQWIEGEQSASNEDEVDEVDEVEMVSSTGKNKESLFQGKNFLFDRRRL